MRPDSPSTHYLRCQFKDFSSREFELVIFPSKPEYLHESLLDDLRIQHSSSPDIYCVQADGSYRPRSIVPDDTSIRPHLPPFPPPANDRSIAEALNPILVVLNAAIQLKRRDFSAALGDPDVVPITFTRYVDLLAIVREVNKLIWFEPVGYRSPETEVETGVVGAVTRNRSAKVAKVVGKTVRGEDGIGLLDDAARAKARFDAFVDLLGPRAFSLL